MLLTVWLVEVDSIESDPVFLLLPRHGWGLKALRAAGLKRLLGVARPSASCILQLNTLLDILSWRGRLGPRLILVPTTARLLETIPTRAISDKSIETLIEAIS